MEYWGVEVKAGESVRVMPDVGSIIRLSQAALGDLKGEGKRLIPLRVKIDGKMLVLGSLSQKNIPQLSFDLLFHKEFELSHDSKDGSVYFIGYKVKINDEDDDFPFDSDDDSEDDLIAINDGNIIKASSTQPKVNVTEPVKEGDNGVSHKNIMNTIDKDEDSDDDSKDANKPKNVTLKEIVIKEGDDSSDEDVDDESDENDESEDDDSKEESEDNEETPPPKEMNVGNRKRSSESVSAILFSVKKAKYETNQDGPKGRRGRGQLQPSRPPIKKNPFSNKSRLQNYNNFRA